MLTNVIARHDDMMPDRMLAYGAPQAEFEQERARAEAANAAARAAAGMPATDAAAGPPPAHAADAGAKAGPSGSGEADFTVGVLAHASPTVLQIMHCSVGIARCSFDFVPTPCSILRTEQDEEGSCVPY